MSKTTRFRFSASAIERLAFPVDAVSSIKTVEFSDLDCPGLKLLGQNDTHFNLHNAQRAI